MRNLPSYYLPGSDDGQPSNSPLAAILGAYAQGIDAIETQKQQAQQILSIIGANGAWLDFLAQLYGIPPRFGGESDGLLLGRILQALTPGTVANLQTILDPYSSKPVTIFEPMGGLAVGRTFADWQEAPTTLTGTFTRATVAIDPANGTQVASGAPIYDSGRFGQALLMWQGTTNLLSAEQSSIETTPLTGITAINNATVAQSNTVAWTGTYSLKVTTTQTMTTTGAGAQGFYVNVTSTTANTAYQGSVYLQGSGTVLVQMYDATHNVFGPGTYVTLTGSWQRVQNVSYTVPGTASTDLRLQVTCSQGATFYADGAQIEAASYSTPFITGGVTRNTETLTLATPSALSATQGTIQGWYQGGQDWETVSGAAGLWESNPGVAGSLQLQLTSTSLSWGIQGGSAATYSYPSSGWSTGWHHIDGTWQASGSNTNLILYVDGVQVAQATSTQAPTFAANLSYGTCASHTADGLLEDWRLLDYARTPAGIESDYASNVMAQASANTLALFNFNGSLTANVGGDYEGSAFYLKVTVWSSTTASSTNGYFDNGYFDIAYFGDSSAPSIASTDISAILATKVPAGVRTLVVQGG